MGIEKQLRFKEDSGLTPTGRFSASSSKFLRFCQNGKYRIFGILSNANWENPAQVRCTKC